MRNLSRITLMLAPALAAGAMVTAQADARSVLWGALVIDRVDMKAGLSYNQPNKSRAINAAKAYCRKRGGKHCQTVTSFSNACGSMYIRPKDLKVGWGVSFYLSDAKKRAKKECGSSSCREVAYSCTRRWR